jgi:hypothetical protein
MTARSGSDEAEQTSSSAARPLLVFAQLAIFGAGVVLLFAADGRWWVFLTASLVLLISFVCGILVVLVKP